MLTRTVERSFRNGRMEDRAYWRELLRSGKYPVRRAGGLRLIERSEVYGYSGEHVRSLRTYVRIPWRGHHPDGDGGRGWWCNIEPTGPESTDYHVHAGQYTIGTHESARAAALALWRLIAAGKLDAAILSAMADEHF